MDGFSISMRCGRSAFLLATTWALFSSPSDAKQVVTKPTASSEATSIHIDGPTLKAINAATKRMLEANKDSPLGTDPSNFEVKIQRQGQSLTLLFYIGPKAGRSWTGGTAKFLVDPTSGDILRAIFYR